MLLCGQFPVSVWASSTRKQSVLPSPLLQHQALQLDALLNRQWSIVACSAVEGSGLLDGFRWLVRDVASRIYLLD